MLWPTPGEHVAHYMVNGWKLATTINMAIIFFIFGITLDTSELKSAMKAWQVILYGMASILFLTPLWGFLALLIPFKPYEFALGLAIMACVPTSLSSGVTLVIQGYGNGALALLFTVASNVLGILTAPLMIKAVLGSSVNAEVNAVDLLIKLGVSILLPLLVGKALREGVKPVRDNICKYKAPLYLINNLQITLIVWQKLSAAREVLVEQETGDVLLAGLAAIVEHFIFLVQNTVITWLLRFPESERKACIVMASQKNLPTAAVIISYFNPQDVGNLGLITIPCIVFYIMQLFIDSFIANTWASKYERLSALEATYKEQLKHFEADHEHTEQRPGAGTADGSADTIGTAFLVKAPPAKAAAGTAAGTGAAIASTPEGLVSAMAAAARVGAAYRNRAAARIARPSNEDGDGAGLLQHVALDHGLVNPLKPPISEDDEDLR